MPRARSDHLLWRADADTAMQALLRVRTLKEPPTIESLAAPGTLARGAVGAHRQTDEQKADTKDNRPCSAVNAQERAGTSGRGSDPHPLSPPKHALPHRRVGVSDHAAEFRLPSSLVGPRIPNARRATRREHERDDRLALGPHLALHAIRVKAELAGEHHHGVVDAPCLDVQRPLAPLVASDPCDFALVEGRRGPPLVGVTRRDENGNHELPARVDPHVHARRREPQL